MHKNRSATPGPVSTSLAYEDLAEAVDWLCRTFGVSERFRYGDPDSPDGLQLAVGAGGIFLRKRRTGEPTNCTHNVDVHVDDVDAYYERATRAGARILNELRSYPFGERQCTVVDLAGHLWTFTQSVADVPPEEWGALPGPAMREPTLGGVVPYLHYEDVAAMLEWYARVFGFTEIKRWPKDDGSIGNAEMAVGDTELWLDGGLPDWWSKDTDHPRQWIGVWVDDPDAMYERATAAGVQVEPPKDFPWGVRSLDVRDPAGYRWGFMKRI